MKKSSDRSRRRKSAQVPATRLATACPTGRVALGFRAPRGGSEDNQDILLPDEAHLITIAPTGAGKTVNCTIPALLQYPGPMIVLDPKGENAAITARRRREMGQEVFVIDPFGVSGQPAAGFNPLDFVEPDSAEAADDARAIAEMLMPLQYDNRDVFWRSRAMHFLTVAILHAVTDFQPGTRNLGTVRNIVHQMAKAATHKQTDSSRALQENLHLKSRHPDVGRLNELFDLGSVETIGGMIHTALEGVGFVRGPLVERSLAASSFKLDDITEGRPVTLYLVMPPHLVASHGIMLRLWLGTLFAALMRRRGRPEHPTLLLLDEAALLGPFPPLRTAITLLRGYGVQTWSFWQDPSQLAHLYPSDWRSMINNCRLVQCFGAHTPAALADLGQVLGIDLDSFELLDKSRMLIQQDGQARLASRIDYRTDPAMRGQYDANPVHVRMAGPLRRPPAQIEVVPAAANSSQPVSQLAGDGFGQLCAALNALWSPARDRA